MAQRNIDEALAGLAGAMISEDQQAMLENGFALLSGFLSDVKRIADSLEIVAAKAGNPGPVIISQDGPSS
jgi:hypothetical protein